jgi:hypothetical protein
MGLDVPRSTFAACEAAKTVVEVVALILSRAALKESTLLFAFVLCDAIISFPLLFIFVSELLLP